MSSAPHRFYTIKHTPPFAASPRAYRNGRKVGADRRAELCAGSGYDPRDLLKKRLIVMAC